MNAARWAGALLGMAGLMVVGSSCIALDAALFSSDDVCGNGVVQDGEQCDDANERDDDACIECQLAFCGDGYLLAGIEKCDPGLDPACPASCVTCGDGLVENGEECDDANASNDDSCLNDCMAARCGDGFIKAGEEACDDGNPSNEDGCLSDCTAARCGDGFVNPEVEACDDANASNDDSCLNDCTAARCGDGFVNPEAEACDDGNPSNEDGCLNECVLATCGDGFVNPEAEACDDGNDLDTDSCVAGCNLATCGDGFVWSEDGGDEECDLTPVTNRDDCDAFCHWCDCNDVPYAPGCFFTCD
jgi:cysteine-rich repeat protein